MSVLKYKDSTGVTHKVGAPKYDVYSKEEVYNKGETYSKEETNALLATAGGGANIVVSEL